MRVEPEEVATALRALPGVLACALFGMTGVMEGRVPNILVNISQIVIGCSLGARMAGMPARRAWAFGFAMNSRGAMEITRGGDALLSSLSSITPWKVSASAPMISASYDGLIVR